MSVTLPLTEDELSAWLRLATAHGLKPAALRRLLGAFGLPQHVLAQPFAALAHAAGEAAAQAALAPPEPGFEARVAALQAWRAQPGHAVVTLADPAYPPRLLTMPDPPPLLYLQGRLELLHARGVAIVGSRSATPQAVEDSQRFARALSAAGLVVVSGLAFGVDGAAHRGALEAPGSTVAVIGTGADLVYPPAHRSLAARIAGRGAIVSEWPLGTPARSANFPQRNRVIAALVEGVLVVEAAMRSGSLITARLANEMGRDVFALPGSIHAPLTRGCHRLIKQGAQLVETPEEVLEALGVAAVAQPAGGAVRQAKALASGRGRRTAPDKQPEAGSAAAGIPAQATGSIRPGDGAGSAASSESVSPARLAATARAAADLAPEAWRLLEALGHAPATLEILARRTDMPSEALSGTLLQLELAGHLYALPGGWFVRATHG